MRSAKTRAAWIGSGWGQYHAAGVPDLKVVQQVLLALYHRHQERYTIDHLVEHIETVVAEQPARRPRRCASST